MSDAQGSKRRGPRWGSAARAAVFVGLVALPAIAQQPSAAEVATAREFGVKGLKLAADGNCKDAIEPLARAEKIFSAPTTLAQLGECQIKTGKLVAGTEALQRVVRAELAPSAPPAFRTAQEKSKKLLDETLPRIGKLRISVSPAAADLKVTFDGELVPGALLDADRPTDPGPHTVEATAPGMLAARAQITLPEGGRDAVKLELRPDPNAAVLPPPVASSAPRPSATSPSVPPPPAKAHSKVLPYTLIGVGAVGVGVGAVFGLMAKSHKSTLDGTCIASKVCPLSSKGEYDTASSDATWSTIGFGVGAAAVAAGVVLLLVSGGDEPAQTGRGAGVMISSGPAPVGASVAGRF